MKSQSNILPRMALAFVLATGFAVAWCLVGMWTYESGRERGHSEDLHFKADGTPYVVDSDEYFRTRGGQAEVADADKEPPFVRLAAGRRAPLIPGAAPWTWRLRTFGENKQSSAWFFVSDGRSRGFAYFVSYDREANERVGYLGKRGFSEKEPPDEEKFPFATIEDFPFPAWPPAIMSNVHSRQGLFYGLPTIWNRQRETPGDLSQSVVYIQTRDDKVFRINLSERTVGVAFEGEPIRATDLIPFTRGMNSDGAVLAIRTDQAIVLLSARDQVVRRVPIPEELQERDFNWAELPSGEFLAVTGTQDYSHSGKVSQRVFRIDAGGNVTRRDEIWLQASGERSFRVVLGLVMPIPVAIDLHVGLFGPAGSLQNRATDSYGDALAWSLNEFWPSLTIAHLAALGLAWLCYRREVRYGTGPRERIAWPLFVLVFGLPGWIGYRFGRSWPTLEECPRCGQVVPQNRVDCAACHADFPAPALKGTEVFA